MTPDQIRAALSDMQALICTLFGEAANEPVEGQIAVANVIRNRAAHPRWWGRDIRGVCLAKSQFSCWWERNQNTARVYALAEALIRRQDATSSRTVLSQLHWIAAGVVDGLLIDNTQSADHYLTDWLYRSDKCPAWAKRKPPVARIGAHVFFRLEI